MSDTERKLPVKTGEVLPNGAMALAYKVGKFNQLHYVLAVWKNNEYVTWVLDEDKNAMWGNYFPHGDILAAAKDFTERGE